MVGRVDGLDWRVDQGVKLQRQTQEPGHDLVLKVRLYDGAWYPITLALPAMISDFIYENENHLAPPEFGFLGGEFYRNHIDLATREGWRAAQEKLHRERRDSKQQKGEW